MQGAQWQHFTHSLGPGFVKLPVCTHVHAVAAEAGVHQSLNFSLVACACFADTSYSRHLDLMPVVTVSRLHSYPEVFMHVIRVNSVLHLILKQL